MKKIRLILAIAMISIFTAVSCSKGGASPEQAIDDLVKAAKAKDWGKVYDCFSKESTAKLETMLKGFIQLASQMAKMNPEAAKDPKMAQVLELEKLSGKEFFIKFFNTDADTSNKMLGEFDNYKVTKKEINGDKAKLTIKTANKEEETDFIKEDGRWKIDLTPKLNQALQQGQPK